MHTCVRGKGRRGLPRAGPSLHPGLRDGTAVGTTATPVFSGPRGSGRAEPGMWVHRRESQCTCVHTPTRAGKRKCEVIWAPKLLKALLPSDI